MRIHLIAVGGAIMHNLAIALQENGHVVTGSDDEIYNPALDRLQAKGLLPDEMGWNVNSITKDIDLIIAGMHARADNPEFAEAKRLGIPVTSFPAFVYDHSKEKTRIVIAGSHGKTTTTSMVMHVLQYWKLDFDYLVGAQLAGFENMVKLSDAPTIIIEGDEYLSAAFDRRPKFLHYKPHFGVITGIAWDHINVFPEFEDYCNQFLLFIDTLETNGKIFCAASDNRLMTMTESLENCEPYVAFEYEYSDDLTMINHEGQNFKFKFFGQHNIENMAGAAKLCEQLGISTEQFLQAMQTFEGAAKRLQLVHKTDAKLVFQDFAHAPSKVRASINAVRNRYPDKKLIACVELHTFSSLNQDFHAEYAGVFNEVDEGVIFYNSHTLKMKKMPPIDPLQMRNVIAFPALHIISERADLEALLHSFDDQNVVYLMMSSGTFQGLDYLKL